VSLPLVQFILNAALDPGQATEGRQEGLVARQNIEVELEVIGRVDGNRAVFEFVQGMGPGGASVSSCTELLERAWEAG
jgi:hypothetical protein